MTGSDDLVILGSVSGKRATKQITFLKGKKGKSDRIDIKSYSAEKYFAVKEISIASAADLHDALGRLTGDSISFIIRGTPLPNINRHHTRRLLHKDPKSGEGPCFASQARRWLMVDGDHLLEPPLTDLVNRPIDAVQHVIGRLPPELHDVTCFWQLSSSAGLPGSEGFLSLHLWYWCARPYSDEELTRFANFFNRDERIIDIAVYRAVQPHYIAAPLFVGMPDPLPVRYGVWKGLDDELELIIPPADAKDPEKTAATGYEPGEGVEHFLAQIGGPQGFRWPMFQAISSWIAIYGSNADLPPLYNRIRENLDETAPNWRDDPGGRRYIDDDHFNRMADWIRQQHGDQPPKGFIPPVPPHLDEPPPADPSDQPTILDMRPVIHTGGGRLPQAVDEAERILIANDPEVYAFGDQIVRPALRPIAIADNKTTVGLRIVPIGPDHMADRLSRLINFQKFDGRSHKWVSIDCPRVIAVTYLARVGLWHVPRLTALATCPLLLADGRILDKPGFDAASGILFAAQGIKFPPVPERPTREHAAEALDLLMHPFRDYPFVDDASKSVLCALLLSTVSRFAYPFVPCHAFGATGAGTGKSKLFDCASILQTGRECAVISQPEDPAEFEKKLFAELLAGDPLVLIDNCDLPLDDPFLCMTITQRFVKSRLLGLSKNPEIPNAVIIGANGNNFRFAGDMLRRGLTGHLDAGEEKPWERVFDSEDPVLVFKRERPKLVAAALTVLRGYIVAGHPRQKAPPLGGFEGWCRTVRDSLLWLGADDPCLTIESARKADPAEQRRAAVLAQWLIVLSDRSLTTREIIEEACSSTKPNGEDLDRRIYYHPAFRHALLDVAGERGHVDPRRLGTWLGHNKGRVTAVSDLNGGAWKVRITTDTEQYGIGRWQLHAEIENGGNARS
jgi:hypothetical protein